MEITKVESILERESDTIYSILEQEFIQLKYKTANCARLCFEEKNFPESLNCEKKCLKSVKSVANFIQIQQKSLFDRLDKCVAGVEKTRETGFGDTEKGLEGASHCYQEYMENLRNAKKSIIAEFRFYQ